jgi:hypothetical protein
MWRTRYYQTSAGTSSRSARIRPPVFGHLPAHRDRLRRQPAAGRQRLRREPGPEHDAIGSLAGSDAEREGIPHLVLRLRHRTRAESHSRRFIPRCSATLEINGTIDESWKPGDIEQVD